MKLRINGNSIRLRLSQTEVSIFCETEIFRQSIQFGLEEEDRFYYSLEMSDGDILSTMYGIDQMHIFVPRAMAKEWCNSELVSLYADQLIGETGEMLSILVEKDFSCLIEREGEDESDNYPNPNAKSEE